MTGPVEEYRGTRVIVRNNGHRCIHSRYCVLNLNSVFMPDVDGPWINPDGAAREAVIAVVEKCPSGALSYEPLGDSAPEHPPTVNTVRVWEDGPLVFHAELDVVGDTSSFRATLCRCGLSKRKPYCDRSHTEAGFKATGEPASKDTPALAIHNGPLKVMPMPNGPLKVTPMPNGPLKVEGALEICSASGRTISRQTKVLLCRCGHSNNKPFCDSSHKRMGFEG